MMALSSAQQTLLKTNIEANTDPIITQALIDGTHQVIAEFYNDLSSPVYYCWRTSMPVQEIRNEHIDWDELVNQTTNDLLAFQVLTTTTTVDPSNPSLRQAFASIFQGGTGVNTLAALNAAAKRIVNRVEEVLSTKGQAGTEGDPDNLDYEGSVSHQDISKALING